MKRSHLALFLAVALAVTAVACTPRDVAEDACLGGDRPIYTVPGNPTTPWPSSSLSLPNGTAIDARGRTFDASVFNSGGYSTGIKFHYKADSRADLCVTGGSIYTTLDPVNTLFDVWHDSIGVRAETADLHFIGTHFANLGDAIAFSGGATNWKLTGIRADGGGVLDGAYIHDDCVENDGMNSGVLQDSKLDGCHVFMSSFAPGYDGTGNTVVLRDNLVRLQPMYNSYDPAKYGYNQTGGFFKWSGRPQDGIAPRLVVESGTFRADQPAFYGGNVTGWLALPPNTECGDVTLIGTEAWAARDVTSWVSQCDSVTFGTVADWNAQVAEWDAEHPIQTRP